MKSVFNNFFTFITTFIVIVIVVALVVLMFNYQFSIYQKKHGKQMTVIDYLFDPEVK